MKSIMEGDKPSYGKMKKRWRPAIVVFVAATLLFCQGLSAVAQTVHDSAAVHDSTIPSDSISMLISYGSQSVAFSLYFQSDKYNVVENYLTNAAELARLDEFVAGLSQNPQAALQSVTITGTCSFDAPFSYNERLAGNRAGSVEKFLKERYSLLSEVEFSIVVVPEDWTTLRTMVDASQMPERSKSKVLEIIDSQSTPDSKEARIKAIDEGAAYRYILKNFIPLTRRADLTIEFVISEPVLPPVPEEPAAEPPAQPSEEVQPEQEPVIIPEPAVQTGEGKRKKPLYYPKVAIKTNTLLWAGLTPGIDAKYYFVPNFGVEYYFGHRWSANAEMAYTYKTYSGREELRALSAYTGEMRFWFKRDDRFRWLYAGIYGMFGDYDYQNGRKPDQDSFTNYTGKHWGTGLTLGVMVPVYRGFCIEAGVRGGFRHYYTNVYDREVSPYHNYYNYQTRTNEWGLAGVYLNLVYRFGKKVYKED